MRAVSAGRALMPVTTARRMGSYVPYFPTGFYPRYTRGEWKFLDSTITQDINTTPALILLNGLAPGSSASQRIGQKVDIRSIEIRLRWTTTPVTGVDQYCRASIVLDRQPNGAAPGNYTDIFLASSVTSPRSLANRKRFRILWDKALPMGSNLNAATTPSTLPNMRIFKAYMKFRRPIVEEFNSGVAGTVADIATNSLYLVTFGTEVAGNTDVNMAGYIRIRYTDV